MDATVVIPTYNRARLLRETLPMLLAQESAGFTYEIVFVINGSSDESESVLREASQTSGGKLRYFYIAPTGGPSAPRNRGIREARGEIVIILDDDVLPDPGLVAAHVAFHRSHPERECAALGEVYVPDRLMHDPMSLFHAFPYHEVRDKAELEYFHFWTCNVSIKREFMLSHGMFDEKFLYYEDMVCGHKLRRSGMKLHFAAAARGQHLHQLAAGDVPEKGRFTGRWLYIYTDFIREPATNRRFGILSPNIGLPLLAWRLLNRLAFHVFDTPVIVAVLRAVGGESKRRSKVTDLYHWLAFRRNMIVGYYEAKRGAWRPPAAIATQASRLG
jgi:glycosyltransferase involved in cell wall biosynthesis